MTWPSVKQAINDEHAAAGERRNVSGNWRDTCQASGGEACPTRALTRGAATDPNRHLDYIRLSSLRNDPTTLLVTTKN